MATKTRSGCHTFEDFCAIVPHGKKGDLIDGVIHIAPPDPTKVDRLWGWLQVLFSCYVEVKKLGRVFSLRVAFRLDDRNAPEPDIAFLRGEHANRIHRTHVEGPPDLAMEIVSPDSVERDYEKKRKQYEWAGVPEYWIIDDEEKNLLLLRLNPQGQYRKVQLRRGGFHSKIVPGFRLDPNWLWQEPVPFTALEIADKLFAESSAE
jgi:Uma2 family endonuclease